MDAATFRTNFPEFADTTIYPTPTINFWLSVAEKLVNADRWYDLYDQGVQLFVAHHLAIATRNVKTAGAGGIPGSVQGAQTSKSVDKVAVSYDASKVQYDDAGFWNMTTYGLQYWNLVMMVGAGGIQF